MTWRASTIPDAPVGPTTPNSAPKSPKQIPKRRSLRRDDDDEMMRDALIFDCPEH